jgi:hypothetical protein
MTFAWHQNRGRGTGDRRLVVAISAVLLTAYVSYSVVWSKAAYAPLERGGRTATLEEIQALSLYLIRTKPMADANERIK